MNTPRERILKTTSYLFHQQGYNSTGINQIIKEANVAKASFYQHFESKDHLCVAFLNNRHQFWFSELFKFTSTSKNPNDKVLLVFDFIIHMNDQEGFRGCSFLNILSEISKDQEPILAVIQSHKKDLRIFFQELMEDDLLATQIYLLFESSIIESQLFKSNDIVNKAKKITYNLIHNQN